jgi:hypothetical protein
MPTPIDGSDFFLEDNWPINLNDNNCFDKLQNEIPSLLNDNENQIINLSPPNSNYDSTNYSSTPSPSSFSSSSSSSPPSIVNTNKSYNDDDTLLPSTPLLLDILNENTLLTNDPNNVSNDQMMLINSCLDDNHYLINDNDFNSFDINKNSNTNNNRDGVSAESLETEALLDNIEKMLESMDDPNNIETVNNKQQQNNTYNTPQLVFIKNEPFQQNNSTNNQRPKQIAMKPLKKISPKPQSDITKAINRPNNDKSEIIPAAVATVIPILAIPTNQINNNSPIKIVFDNSKMNGLQTTIKLQQQSHNDNNNNNKNDIPLVKRQKKETIPPPIVELHDDEDDEGDIKCEPLDPNLIKKQNRMIKNRESASLSRKRKKEYVETLEEKVKEFSNENTLLLNENTQLKMKISTLEAENKQLKQNLTRSTLAANNISLNMNSTSINGSSGGGGGGGTSAKRPFIMLAIFLVFGLNIFQFVNVNISEPNKSLPDYSKFNSLPFDIDAKEGALIDLQSRSQILPLKSRHLLSDYDYQSSEEEDDRPKAKSIKQTNQKFNKNNNNSIQYININGTLQPISIDLCTRMMSNVSISFNESHLRK